MRDLFLTSLTPVSSIPGIEEVNMIREDGSVVHFNNPKVQYVTSSWYITATSCRYRPVWPPTPSLSPAGLKRNVSVLYTVQC